MGIAIMIYLRYNKTIVDGNKENTKEDIVEQTKKNTLTFGQMYDNFANKRKQEHPIIEECAFFTDKTGELFQCEMRYSLEDSSAWWYFTCYDSEGNECADLCVRPQSEHRFLLDHIYVHKERRGRGIARHMIELLEYMLRDYGAILLRGTFYP